MSVASGLTSANRFAIRVPVFARTFRILRWAARFLRLESRVDSDLANRHLEAILGSQSFDHICFFRSASSGARCALDRDYTRRNSTQLDALGHLFEELLFEVVHAIADGRCPAQLDNLVSKLLRVSRVRRGRGFLSKPKAFRLPE
jgi:hypothetical protein